MRDTTTAVLLSLSACLAWAGRPLNTDDASAADPGVCQLEGWVTSAGSERAFVLAPACGLVEGLELGTDYAVLKPGDNNRAAATLSIKIVPDALRSETPVGDLNFGFKLGAGFAQSPYTGWRSAGGAASVLATLSPNDDWSLHLNLGVLRDRDSGKSGGQANLALTWTPREEMLLFAEYLGGTRRDVFGGSISSAGGRWWLIKERLGLDLSVSRVAGSELGTVWSLGFGWYGQ